MIGNPICIYWGKGGRAVTLWVLPRLNCNSLLRRCDSSVNVRQTWKRAIDMNTVPASGMKLGRNHSFSPLPVFHSPEAVISYN